MPMNTENLTPAGQPSGLSVIAGSTRVGNCPLEQKIALALNAAGIEYVTDFEGKSRLDFFLTKHGVHIEVKGAHTPRISGQMKSAANVIVAQGDKAVELLAALLRSNTAVGHERSELSGPTG